MSNDRLDRWLGANWVDVPADARTAVVEHIFGTDLATLSTYAVAEVRCLLARHGIDAPFDVEDIAQDVIGDLVTSLPAGRVTHWRACVLHRVVRRIRHRGHGPTIDHYLLRTALEAVEHPEIAAVLAATFVLAPDGSHVDIRTAAEVARDLGYSRSDIECLRRRGLRELRDHLVQLMPDPL
ncbi:hypothetical protein ACFVMC_26525 [Nocardia sp. NPDC127579]|uniref:hypothetical protein n=1 Tax=Nocardia sp. NPDC127579 TaxID=3345402 RepID=UPI0036422A53